MYIGGKERGLGERRVVKKKKGKSGGEKEKRGTEARLKP